MPSSYLAATRFAAIGTSIFLTCRDESQLPRIELIARSFLLDLDRTCSRFRHDSDLSRVNRGAGSWVAVDALLLAAVQASLAMACETDGLVNPLLGRSIVSLGYDRDFKTLVPVAPTLIEAPKTDAWKQIDIQDNGIKIPANTALDLGSIGKAWATDMIAATVTAELGELDALIDIGGDIALCGDSEWPIAIQQRLAASSPDQVVWVRGGGLATSSTRVRRWSWAGVDRHHLIDPRSGYSAADVWAMVSATGPTCTAANAASTAAIVLGEDAPGWLSDRGVDAGLVRTDGSVVRTGAWPEPGESTDAEAVRR